MSPKHDEGRGKIHEMREYLCWYFWTGCLGKTLKQTNKIFSLFFLDIMWLNIALDCRNMFCFLFFCLFCCIFFFFFSRVSQYFVLLFLILLGILGCWSMKMSSIARGQIRIRSACFPTAISRIKLFAHLGAADGKQTSSCESRRLGGSQLIKHRGSYEGSAPIRPVTACVLTRVWTWSPRSREDVPRTYIRYKRSRSCIFPRWKSSWRGRKSAGQRWTAMEATSAPHTRPPVAEVRGAAT